MYSKLIRITLSIFLGAYFLGCNLPINEKVPTPATPDTKLGDSTKCLDNVLQVMEDYLKGTAKSSDVAATWDCFGSAISLFQKSTRGQYSDRFQARELANFFETYFLKDGAVISDSLLAEIFRLKQLFVGGSSEFITRTEMTKLIQFSQSMKGISIRLLPYMPVYSQKWKTNGFMSIEMDIRYFEAANLEIQRAAKDFGAIIAQNGQSYEIRNIIKLLDEVSKLYEADWSWLEDLREALPLVYKLKKALAGGLEDTIAPYEWRRFGLIGSRAYIQYLRYFYFLKQKEDEAGSPELIYLARSIDDLFSFLGDMVREKPEGVFTREELVHLLQAVSDLYPNFRISEKLVLEFMKIKRLIFGGSLDSWEPSDFDRARSKVEQYRTLAEKFLYFVSIYGMDWRPEDFSEEDAQNHFREAEESLKQVGERLGQLIEENYDIQDLLSFGAEWDRLYPPKEEGKGVGQFFDAYTPILVSIKNLIFSDTDSVIRKNQWTEFLKLSAEFYNRFLYYNYFLQKRESLLQGYGLESLYTLVSDSANLLDRIILMKPANPVSTISFAEIDNLLAGTLKSGLLPEKLTLPTLQSTVKVVVQKMLIDPERRLKGTPPPGITLDFTQVARTEFSLWYSNQKFFEKIYQNRSPEQGIPGREILERITHEPLSVGLEEIRKILKSPLNMSYDPLKRLYLGPLDYPYTISSVSMVNVSRSIMRIIIRSYAMDLSRVINYTGVNLAEAEELFKDIRPAAVELGLLDPRSATFAQNRFRESNLFTTTANGDEYMSFKEGSDLFLMIFSGVTIANMVSENLDSVCPIDRTPELKDDHNVDLNCFISYYGGKIPEAFSAMPDFVNFYSQLDDESFQRVLINLLKAAGYVPDDSGRLKLGDSALVPHVTQYVETIMQKYDSNKDGYLERDEALRAFPTFRNILKDVSNLKKESQLKAIFTYLLKHAKAPSGAKEYIKFITWWLRGEKAWKFKADRERLALILGFIADSVRDSSKKVNVPEELERRVREENSRIH